MLNKQVLRIEKPLGYMLNKQVLRVKKPTNQALQNTSLRVEYPISPNDFCPFNNSNSSKTFTPQQETRIPPGTSPPPEGLGEAPSQDLFTLLYPTVSSHIPSFGGAWGGSISLVFGLASLVCAFCFLSISFLLTFQSTPFCSVKDALLHRKRASFAV